MQQSSANRMVLLTKRNQLALASQGATLLRNKRAALLKELMAILKPLVKAHAKLYGNMRQAEQSLHLAKALDGTPVLAALGVAFRRSLELEIGERRFWGVRLPEFTFGDTARSVSELTGLASGISACASEAAHDFDTVLASLLALLPLELRLVRLGDEIRKTSRRVNALDQILIPRLRSDLKHITQVLEEMEREDLFRLRRVKKKRNRIGVADYAIDGILK